jgi:hypothetical protein
MGLTHHQKNSKNSQKCEKSIAKTLQIPNGEMTVLMGYTRESCDFPKKGILMDYIIRSCDLFWVRISKKGNFD